MRNSELDQQARPDSSSGMPAPDTSDDPVNRELPSEVQADFAPIEELDADADEFETSTDHYDRDSRRAERSFDEAVAAAGRGDKERAVALFLKTAKLAETAREWYLSATACHRVGDFLINPKPPVDLERAFRMYRRAIAAYERCGMVTAARKLSYSLMCIRMCRSREFDLHLGHRIQLFLFWATAGFGYRPLRVIGTAVVAVFVYAAIFWGIEGVVAANSGETADFWHSFYFSGITFATVGYGDFIPAPHAQMLALTEGALGAFTMGFFVAVLANWFSKT